ncbi:MAG: signal peptidase II [Rhodospirillales bacterium]|nr:signal peptidase II [Rhodospirillales bacterium]
MTRGRHAALGFVVALAVLAADQVSKWWVLDVLGLARRAPLVLLPVLDLRMVQNRGITFGLLNGPETIGPLLLALVAIAVVFGLGVWLWRADRAVIAAAVGAIAGGATGNIVDRLRLGFVVDFIQAHAFGWSWYVFNLADAAIVCGVAALLIDGLLAGRRSGERPAGGWGARGERERR